MKSGEKSIWKRKFAKHQTEKKNQTEKANRREKHLEKPKKTPGREQKKNA
jgi:hypothetical protein